MSPLPNFHKDFAHDDLGFIEHFYLPSLSRLSVISHSSQLLGNTLEALPKPAARKFDFLCVRKPSILTPQTIDKFMISMYIPIGFR